ncbi:MAG: response regulator [Bdellovibrionota bacterium]|nr:response regulator [Bdellovibrionota bacterium]
MDKVELKPKILVVDDEEDVREVICDYIEDIGLGVQTIVASNIEEAITKTKDDEVALILVDYSMPGGNGIELSKRLKKILPDTNIIMITGRADKQLVIDGMRKGLNDFIEKPLDPNLFKKIITGHVNDFIAKKEEEARELLLIKKSFIEESLDLFDNTDNYILRLEEDYYEDEVVNNLFRRLHTIKGGALAVEGCEILAKLVHVWETCLQKIKKDKKRPNADGISLFLDAKDHSLKLLGLFDSGEKIKSDYIKKLDDLENKLRKVTYIDYPKEHPRKRIKAAEITLGVDIEDGLFVSNPKLDSLLNLTGDLVNLKNNLKGHIQKKAKDSKKEDLEEIENIYDSMNKLTDRFQTKIMEIRQFSLAKFLNRIPRLIRTVAHDLGKLIKYEIKGAEVLVDRNVAKALNLSLTHILRNSCDHGIENPDDRKRLGKDSSGTIVLEVKEHKENIIVKISDDGKGMDKDLILAKAIKNELVPTNKINHLTDEEIFDFIFHPGFSTAEEVTSVSGRGVGMDVVKNHIDKLNGEIHIKSQIGKGTEITITIPAQRTLLVERFMIGSCQGDFIAFPLKSVVAVENLDDKERSQINSQETYDFKGEKIPLSTYSSFLGLESDRKDKTLNAETVIILGEEENKIAVLLEKVTRQIETVVRPFNKILPKIPGFRGTCYLSDETFAFVISSSELFNSSITEKEKAA